MEEDWEEDDASLKQEDKRCISDRSDRSIKLNCSTQAVRIGREVEYEEHANR